MIDNKALNRFLSSFSDFEKKIITNFSKLLTATQADIYLVMARKAACLIEAFEDIGIVSLNGTIVSERILDMDEHYLATFFKNKKVIIIDDTIVSGTTISMTLERLVNYRVNSIEVRVLTVNKKWYTKELLIAQQELAKQKGVKIVLQELIELSDADSIKFCFDIVKGLSILPKLYDFDFPRFIIGKIKLKKAMDIFSNLDGWIYYDTASRLQVSENIFSYTGILTQDRMISFENYIGVNLSQVANVKIRFLGKINGREIERESNEDIINFSLYAFPMIIFDVVDKEDINSLFDKICSQNDIKESFVFVSEKSKLRFIQYFIALRLMNFWYEQAFKNDTTDLYKKRNCVVEKMLFTSVGVELLNTLIKLDANIDYKFKNSLHKTVSSAKYLIPSFTGNSSNESNDFILKTKLLEPFVYFYENKELPCRQAVKDYDYHEFDSKNFKEYLAGKDIDICRLEKGITFNELADRISYVSPEYEYLTFASIFLDKMISRGIAVPVLQETASSVFRAYRHGEDAIFGDAENQIVTSTLSEICKTANRSKLTKIETEKLISLFIKFGVKQKWLDELQSDDQTLRSDQIVVTTRHDTYGMRADIKSNDKVVGEDEISTVSFGKHNWFVPYLIKKGYITATSGGYNFNKRFTTELYNNSDAKPDIEAFILTFAEVLKNFDKNGDLINEVAPSGLYADSSTSDGNKSTETNIEMVLTILASCLYPKDQIDALAAEIYLFKSYWPAAKCNFAYFYNSLQRESFIKRFNNALIAINSGQRKFGAYKSGEVNTIVEKLKGTFSHKIFAAEMDRILDLRLRDSKQENSEELIKNLGYWLIGTNFAVRLLKVCILLNENDQLKQYFKSNVKELNENYNDFILHTDTFDSKDQIIEKLKSIDKTRIKGKSELLIAIADAYLYFYKAEQIDKNLKSIDLLIEVKRKLFNENYNFKNLSEIGDSILNIINFLIERTKYLLNNAAIEIEYFEKPNQKKYYQTAICIKPVPSIFDIVKQELLKIEATHKGNNEFANIMIAQKSIIPDGITVLINNVDDNSYAKIVLNKLKNYIPGFEQLIVLNNLSVTYSFRVIRQRNEPRLTVHFNTVIDLIDKVLKDNNFSRYFITEIGSIKTSILEQLGLKQINFPVTVEMDDSICYSIMSFEFKHIDKSKVKVGIITALPEEFNAMKKLIMHAKKVVCSRARGAGHTYYFGYLPTSSGNYEPVALCLIDGMGNNKAAIRAQNLLMDIPQIKYVIMTGIAGAVPNHNNAENHVRLGDVVISDERGIIQYDFAKLQGNVDDIVLKGNKIAVGAKLIEASNELMRETNSSEKEKILNDILEERPAKDELYDVDGNIIDHPKDNKRIEGQPRLFIDCIGAANTLLKDNKLRDMLRDKYGIKAIEMEGSGIADAAWYSEANYIVVRGTCDYCDKYKNDDWHHYASAVAATYTKWLIFYLFK